VTATWDDLFADIQEVEVKASFRGVGRAAGGAARAGWRGVGHASVW